MRFNALEIALVATTITASDARYDPARDRFGWFVADRDAR